ncbi:hypothetical protein A2U01_0110661, partial [Trifolium medium]|nr:hypothetical protein [Trifolium medium]
RWFGYRAAVNPNEEEAESGKHEQIERDRVAGRCWGFSDEIGKLVIAEPGGGGTRDCRKATNPIRANSYRF